MVHPWLDPNWGVIPDLYLNGIYGKRHEAVPELTLYSQTCTCTQSRPEDVPFFL